MPKTKVLSLRLNVSLIKMLDKVAKKRRITRVSLIRERVEPLDFQTLSLRVCEQRIILKKPTVFHCNLEVKKILIENNCELDFIGMKVKVHKNLKAFFCSEG